MVMKRNALWSHAALAVVSLLCVLVPTDSDAQQPKIVKGVRAAEIAAQNAARNAVIKGLINGIGNMPQVRPDVGSVLPPPVSSVMSRLTPKLPTVPHAFPKLPAGVLAQRDAKVKNRFLSYAKIESQSIDDPNPQSFPLADGQRKMASHIYNEIMSFGGKEVKVTLSDDQYVYVDIPSNVEENVPSILFMAHMDVTPEAPGKGIRPLVHSNYDGGVITLGNGITLSPDTPQGAHLKDLRGKTIITSDGTTLLGADDKTGCTVLVTMLEEIIRNSKFKHGRVMVMLSQNEDVGKAAYRYDPKVFGTRPDIVIDVDGDDPHAFSVANFTAIGQSYYFKGNMAHPSHGLENEYGDALTAASYFVGSLPPSAHPSASAGQKGYLHCYACVHPKDNTGKEISDEYVAKIRLRYFDKNEGDTLRLYLDSAFARTSRAFPFVKVTQGEPTLQYENIAYSMPKYVPQLITMATAKELLTTTPRYERGGTTSAMLSARMPDMIPGGPCIYSGQQSEHSIYEWCCVEEMSQMVSVVENILSIVTKMKWNQTK